MNLLCSSTLALRADKILHGRPARGLIPLLCSLPPFYCPPLMWDRMSSWRRGKQTITTLGAAELNAAKCEDRQTQEHRGQTDRYFPVMAESADMEQLLTSFRKFAIHGDTKATGKELNGKNWAKLCKDCKITDGKNVTATDVDIVFSKVKQKTSRVITYEEFRRALEELAPKRFKGQSKEEALESIFRLVEGKEPTNVGVTKVAKTAAVDRLTDASRYTGSHKERFDQSGKGKGREGREELVENTGYVGAYKNAGTYDNKTKMEK